MNGEHRIRLREGEYPQEDTHLLFIYNACSFMVTIQPMLNSLAKEFIIEQFVLSCNICYTNSYPQNDSL